ncbi:MAG: DNA topoisomerase IB [Flavobacteriaceae bacterium]
MCSSPRRIAPATSPARSCPSSEGTELRGSPSPAARPDPLDSASQAELVHVNDSDPGIARRQRGKGFSYTRPNGSIIRDEKTLARIRSLAIPPAWTDVWICPVAQGHIQATGRDARGRKQYRYHPGWETCRYEAKFASLAAFAEALPRLRKRVKKDLAKRGMRRERILAAIVWLLDNTMIRIGNDAYRRENRSFGLTTLTARHVETQGSEIRFSFTGKSGRKWRLSLSNRRIANILAGMSELPGQHLFQYAGDDGAMHPVHSHHVNDYIREATGSDFTSKHFRTWGATSMATVELAAVEPPPSKQARRRIVNEILDSVSEALKNTRAVCRRCYVHPDVIDAWESRTLGPEIAALRSRYRKPFAHLDADESTVLRWLRQRGTA